MMERDSTDYIKLVKSSKCKNHKTVIVLVLTIFLRKALCMTKLVRDRNDNAKKNTTLRYNFKFGKTVFLTTEHKRPVIATRRARVFK